MRRYSTPHLPMKYTIRKQRRINTQLARKKYTQAVTPHLQFVHHGLPEIFDNVLADALIDEALSAAVDKLCECLEKLGVVFV